MESMTLAHVLLLHAAWLAAAPFARAALRKLPKNLRGSLYLEHLF
jgi:hypothetical protein